MKKFLLLPATLMTIATVLLSSCETGEDSPDDGNTPVVSVDDVSLNKTTLTLNVGDSERLIAEVWPDNADNKTVIWSSSPQSVATVDQNGLVTAINQGAATVIATTQDGGKKAVCTITVNPVKQMTMTIITAAKMGRMTFNLTGSGEATVDWGDQRSDTYSLSPNESTACVHAYSGSFSRTITISGNNITELYIGQFGYDFPAGLDVGLNTALTELYVDSDNLTSLNVRGCYALKSLWCTGSALTSLNVSGCSALEKLDCRRNRLVNINVAGCTSLKEMDCGQNRLTYLSVEGCNKLNDLNCYLNLMEAPALNNLFGSLNSSTDIGDKIIFIGNNGADHVSGTVQCDQSIATAKGWRVTY